MDSKILAKLAVGIVAFIAGFALGSLWTENKMLKGGLTGTSAGVVAPTGGELPSGPTAEVLSNIPEVTADDHVRGNRNADILLVEYSDYECPFCNAFHPTMKQVLDEYGDQVAWVYRHFPLSFHPQAQISAEAAECVAKLGGNEAFWQYTDFLFEDAAVSGGLALSKEKLVARAADAGISSTAVESCLDAGETTALVNEDNTGGRNAGINGTPGTILVTSDGQYELISGALPFEQVKMIIDQYL